MDEYESMKHLQGQVHLLMTVLANLLRASPPHIRDEIMQPLTEMSGDAGPFTQGTVFARDRLMTLVNESD